MRYQIAGLLDGALRGMGFKSIQSQFALAFVLIIIFSLGSVVSLYFTMSATAETVNIAGRQRMLSQRLAKEVLLVSQGVEKEAVVEKTIALFDQSHRSLLHGNRAAGIVKPENAEITQQLKKVEGLWLSYKRSVNAYLSTKSTNELENIKSQSVVVLREMNKAVGMMAKASDSAVKTGQLVAFLFAVGVFVLAFVSLFFGMYWLMNQLDLLKQKLGLVASGDFTQHINEDASDNEVGQMFAAYNSVVAQVGELVAKVKSIAVSISEQNQTLVNSTESSEHNVLKQNAEIEQVASAVTEMSVSVNEVAQHASLASENAIAITKEVNDGKQVVERTHRNIGELSSDLQSAVDVMQQLDSDSQEIGNVLTVITGIAEQTNLLALNAAIEAARAGEQGRGFAVVADEVRTLAQRTQESTEEIQKIIESLQNQTGKAVAVMETSTKAAQSSAELITKANDSLAEIVTAIAGIQDVNGLIATAAQEQANVSTEIDSNVSNISSLSCETTELASSLQSVVQGVDREVVQLSETVANLKTAS